MLVFQSNRFRCGQRWLSSVLSSFGKRWAGRDSKFGYFDKKVTPEETLPNSVSYCSKVEEENVEMWKGPATAARPVTLMRGDGSLKRSLSLKPLGYNSISDVHVIGTGRPVPAEILWHDWTSDDDREVKSWTQTLSLLHSFPSCIHPPRRSEVERLADVDRKRLACPLVISCYSCTFYP